MTIRPNRFLSLVGGIGFVGFAVFLLVLGSRMSSGFDVAITVGMALFAASVGCFFLYQAATDSASAKIVGARPDVSQRLAQLDALLRRNAIGASEYAQQRERILREL